MHPNSSYLIQHLEALPLLDGRYRDIKVMSINRATGVRRGCFSLVFRAFDELEDQFVALKFFDIAPDNLRMIYRREAFRREHAVLQALMSKERCLQLASSLKHFDIPLPGSGGAEVPCEYFAVEWIDQEIDHYFLEQQTFGALEKLRLFNEIVLAVEALHRHTVFHRDVKADNLRAYTKALKRIVVAIDLGTAALWDSPAALDEYSCQVGHQAYSPPEAICYFAGDREIAPFSDVYALGCLLYELFNLESFFVAQRQVNANYDMFVAAMYTKIGAATTPDMRLEVWKTEVNKICKSIVSPPIDGIGSSVPEGIASVLNPVVALLTHADFRQRPKLEVVRRRIWAAIRALENEREYQFRLAQARDRRKKREEKVRRREARLLTALSLRLEQC